MKVSKLPKSLRRLRGEGIAAHWAAARPVATSGSLVVSGGVAAAGAGKRAACRYGASAVAPKNSKWYLLIARGKRLSHFADFAASVIAARGREFVVGESSPLGATWSLPAPLLAHYKRLSAACVLGTQGCSQGEQTWAGRRNTFGVKADKDVGKERGSALGNEWRESNSGP